MNDLPDDQTDAYRSMSTSELLEAWEAARNEREVDVIHGLLDERGYWSASPTPGDDEKAPAIARRTPDEMDVLVGRGVLLAWVILMVLSTAGMALGALLSPTLPPGVEDLAVVWVVVIVLGASTAGLIALFIVTRRAAQIAFKILAILMVGGLVIDGIDLYSQWALNGQSPTLVSWLQPAITLFMLVVFTRGARAARRLKDAQGLAPPARSVH